MRPYAPLAAALVLACAGCGGRPAAVTPRPGWSAVPGQVAEERTVAPAPVRAEPVSLRIPAIGVRSALERLAVDASGELRAPTNPSTAGWFAAGVRPGDPGPAVIAGHLDSLTGPAVFARLGSLRPGALIAVTDARGSVVRFQVSAVRRYPKARFPTGEVYGATPDPQLRLVTCGGEFDRVRGHYLDNLIVFADLTSR